MRRIRPAPWEESSLCGAVFNVLSKRPVKCLSEHAQHLPFDYMVSTLPVSCRERTCCESLQFRKGL